MARRHRSISFIGEEPTARVLKKRHGASDEDCRTMVVKGCYEFGLRDSVNDTAIGHVNFLKPVEKMLEECRVLSGGVASPIHSPTRNSQLTLLIPSRPNICADLQT